jgi:hypothetical protein
MNQNKYIRAFVAGSAFPIIVIPYTYIGLPLLLKPDSDITYQFDVWLVPILIGLLNVIFIRYKNSWALSSVQKYWLFGAINGLFFSLLGTLLTNIPTDLFGLSDTTKFTMIPVAMILYGLIWRYIVRNINIMMNIESI